MSTRNLVEFDFENEIIAQAESKLAPRKGEEISIAGKDYKVVRVKWVVSHPEEFRFTELGAIVYLERIDDVE